MVLSRPARTESTGGSNQIIRYATEQDIGYFFILRNLPDALNLSKSQESVSWPEHQAWYDEVVKGKDILLFAIGDTGMLRCDRRELDVVMSIYLMPQYRRRGMGKVAMNEAMRECRKRWPVEKFMAYVRAENETSRAFFRSLGFIKAGMEEGLVRMESP